MKLGKFLGIPVTLDPSWFLVFGLVVASLLHGEYPQLPGPAAKSPGLLLAIGGALLLFASVLAHEIGHCVVGRRLGIEIDGITLFIFGGIARMKDEPRTAGAEFWMTAAGPAVSAALGVLFYGLATLSATAGLPAAVVSVLGYVCLANFTIAVFNLIPAFPLDGGRLFRALVWAWRRDSLLATRWAAGLSRTIAMAGMAHGAYLILRGDMSGLWEMVIAMFVMSTARGAYEQAAVRARLESLTVGSLVPSGVHSVPARTTLNFAIDEFDSNGRTEAIPVEEGGEVRAILSLDAILAVPERQRPWTTALEVAEPVRGEDAIDARASLWQAFTRMISAGNHRLLVTSNGHILGVITQTQILRLLSLRPAR